jgi:hypothetical protein
MSSGQDKSLVTKRLQAKPSVPQYFTMKKVKIYPFENVGDNLSDNTASHATRKYPSLFIRISTL